MAIWRHGDVMAMMRYDIAILRHGDMMPRYYDIATLYGVIAICRYDIAILPYGDMLWRYCDMALWGYDIEILQ